MRHAGIKEGVAQMGADAGTDTRIMWHVRVSRELADAVGALARAERRTVVAQVVVLLEEGVRRAQERRRRAEDGARTVGAA